MTKQRKTNDTMIAQINYVNTKLKTLETIITHQSLSDIIPNYIFSINKT